MKKRILVMGEKLQGATWLKYLIESDLFEIIGGVPRKKMKDAWWDIELFEDILKANNIPVVSRKDIPMLEYDILWSLMYGFIIEPGEIERGEYALNLHESPLPKYRGCNGYTHAILSDDDSYGTTFHYLDSKLDHGEIIDQEIFPINKYETSKELYQRTMAISAMVFKRNLTRVASGKIESKQNNTEDEPIRMRSSLVGLKQINSDCDMNDVFRYARAFDFVPFEPAYFDIDGKKVYVFLNNSFGRRYLRHIKIMDNCSSIEQLVHNAYEKEAVACQHAYRELAFMHEDEYNQYFSIFQPGYSWLNEK